MRGRLIPTLAPLLGCLLLTLAAVAPAWAEEPPTIGELSFLDRQFMDRQRSRLEELTRSEYGSGFTGRTDHDLALLQRILDDELVGPDQTAELQAMGLVLGELLAEELDMHWVIYSDEVGRSRALRYRDSDLYLFPMTMISRRWEAGAKTPVEEIYSKAVETVRSELPAAPFQ